MKPSLKKTPPKTYTIHCYDPENKQSQRRNHTETIDYTSQRAILSVKTLPDPWPWEKAKNKLLALAKNDPKLHATEQNIHLTNARQEVGGRTTYIHTAISRKTPEEFIHRMNKDDATFFITIAHPTHRAMCRVSVSRTDKPIHRVLENETICWSAKHRLVFDHDNQRTELSQKDRHVRKHFDPKQKSKPKKKINF